jgi:hypothetical protein
MEDWLTLATQRAVVIRSLKVSAIVGTALLAINQGDLLLEGIFPPHLLWKIPLTYLVPYMVSTYGAVSALLAQEPRQ